MVRFVDLKTGNTFSGEYPYMFWFDGEQSINMIYTQPICFISDKKQLNISIPVNDIFKLLDPSKLQQSDSIDLHGFKYHDIHQLYAEDNILTLNGTPHHNYYVYLIYISGCTVQAGEYLESFIIDNEEYKIGADFYGEEESLYVNLSNMGVEIPETIQKALYTVNIHEDKRDNILLNRKFKELLSNYWDLIACKGSYKSLYNTLKWFEYGDLIKLSEIWKKEDEFGTKYYLKDIQTIFTDKYYDSLSSFSKTTYLSLSCALEKIVKDENGRTKLDDEKNPVLEKTIFNWSIQDLSLKMSMLGNFYETYFLPIHLDLIHSTIEDVVYANTIKSIKSAVLDRSDFVYNCEEFNCNIKDNDKFILDIVKCYVGPNTLFKNGNGVQKEMPELTLQDTHNDDIGMYNENLFNDVGVIVDFDINIPINSNDNIKKETLIIDNKRTDEYKLLNKEIHFSLLFKENKEYDIYLQFESISGKLFVKHLKINVVDSEHTTIKIYKIQNKPVITEEDLKSISGINKYHLSFTNQLENTELYKQYIPSIIKNKGDNSWGWRGVCLNHLLILHSNIYDSQKDTYININSVDVFNNIIKNNYFIIQKDVYDAYKKQKNLAYYICISKKYGEQGPININKRFIYRDDYIFIPEFHELQEIKGDKLEDYTISQYDALCVIPELPYGKKIDSFYWEFVNKSTSEVISLNNIKEPFIANNHGSYLTPGYYDIKFNFKLNKDDVVNTAELNSAFLIKKGSL